MSSFVKRSAPPPDVKEGEILKTRILDIKRVTSQWKNNDGSPKEQLELQLELENGFRAKTWISYCANPSDKSALGRLALAFEQSNKTRFNTMDDFLAALQRFGAVYVKVKSFREYEGRLYPTFSLFSDKIPTPTQEQGKL